MLIQIFYLMKINFKNSIFIKIAIYFLSFLLVSFFIMILITPKIDNLPESRVIYDKNNIEI